MDRDGLRLPQLQASAPVAVTDGIMVQVETPDGWRSMPWQVALVQVLQSIRYELAELRKANAE